MVTVSDTRVLLFGGMTDLGWSDELFSLDFLAAANLTVRCTRLNDQNVTGDELSGQFNTVQVHTALFPEPLCSSDDAVCGGLIPSRKLLHMTQRNVQLRAYTHAY